MSSLAFSRWAVALALCTVPMHALPHEQHGGKPASGQTASPSAGYAFALPEPGSYHLPPIRQAAGGKVLDETGKQRELMDFLQGRITVIAFIYTRCGDVCPTATLQLSLLQDRAAKDKELAGRMHLVSMSFDPEHDTPGVMAEYAAQWRSGEAGAPEWHFLTAPDRASLTPVLAAYDQSIATKPGTGASDELYHIFRAFLVDPTGQIRNIYSLDFLDPELVLNDVRTLLLDLKTDEQRMPVTR